MAAHALGEGADLATHVVELCEHGADVPRERQARLAGHDALGIAVEQLEPGEFFQILDTLGGGRWGDVLPGGCAPDLPLLDGAEEQLEGEEVDPADQGLDGKAAAHGATLAPSAVNDANVTTPRKAGRASGVSLRSIAAKIICR